VPYAPRVPDAVGVIGTVVLGAATIAYGIVLVGGYAVAGLATS